MATLDEIEALSVAELAGMADCAVPNPDLGSAGDTFLINVTADFIDRAREAVESGDADDPNAQWWDGVRHETADNAPNVYTATRWREFGDLAAWMEEPDAGEWPSDLTEMAGVALYQIADRLFGALAEMWTFEVGGPDDPRPYAPELPCGCRPHVTRTTGLGFRCDTEDQGYCNFECTCDEGE